ncbi:Synaptobrevin [Armadillidium nasatum]|uniref:Synaptobrevin n=1 Tax=Armadillidium nasatum TaxID=96803 RepID=A0A5N5TJF6_9CRUS|nr:Synaptobrevin [Armadillidium nasatum]
MSTEGGPAAPATGDTLGTGENGEIVGGPRTPQQIAAQKRVQQTQAQVDEVVGIMRVNVERVLERDQKLSELDYRAVFLFPQVVDIMRTNVEKVLERDQKLSELDDRAGPYIPMGGSGAPQQPAAGVQPVQYTQQVAPQAAQNVPQPVQSNQPAQ